MSEQVPMVRQWQLLKLLATRPQGITLKQMAAEMRVSNKTIRRDLQLFRRVGFPVEETAGEFGGKTWRVAVAWYSAPPVFAFDEALALYLGQKFLQPLAGTLIGEAAANAFRKIRQSLGPSVLRYLDKMSGVFQQTDFGISEYAQHAQILEQLLMGIEERRVVFLTYRSLRATEPVTYDVHPYRIVRHQGALYLIGYKVEADELRTWRIDRIERADLERMPFSFPADLDLDARFAGSLGIYEGHDDVTVKIRFTATAARLVREKTWHASQHLTPQPDGSLLVELHLSSTVEVKPWLLSFGPEAEVLEPATLRAELAADLQRTLALYRRVPTRTPAPGEPRKARPPRKPTRPATSDQ